MYSRRWGMGNLAGKDTCRSASGDRDTAFGLGGVHRRPATGINTPPVNNNPFTQADAPRQLLAIRHYRRPEPPTLRWDLHSFNKSKTPTTSTDTREISPPQKFGHVTSTHPHNHGLAAQANDPCQGGSQGQRTRRQVHQDRHGCGQGQIVVVYDGCRGFHENSC